MTELQLEIAASAARWVVEEGLGFGPAKHRAVKALGLPQRTPLPSNELLEAQIWDYIAVFCADTQPQELLALRQHALRWMLRLAQWQPHLGGAIWLGWATRWSDIELALFCDDAKQVEIALINQNCRYQVSEQAGLQGQAVPVLSVHSHCPELGEEVGVHLRLHPHDALRGALLRDAQGRSPRGDIAAVQRLLAQDAAK